MSGYDPERDPVRRAGRVLRWSVPWLVLPALFGVFVAGDIDARALPLFGPERETAVLFLDGQAYFGHLDDTGESGTLTLRDVYYFEDTKGGPSGLPVALVRRGLEVHEPADGMRINRERVLALEQVGPSSSVAQAIQAERRIAKQSPAFVSLNPIVVAGASAVAVQRVATEHVLQRAHTAAVDRIAKLNELVLPVTKTEAQAISAKAVADFGVVRRNALAAVAAALGMGPSETESYVRTTDAQLDVQTFANEPGVLLAPDLNAIVKRASTLYAQVGDAAAKQLTQPKATAAPSASPAASPTPPVSPSPSPSATARP